jgi:copper chaperone CopZ
MREIIKKRKIRVEGINDVPAGEKLGKVLAGVRGVTSVDVFMEGYVLCEYDLTETRLEKIEKMIEKEGFRLNESLTGRLKRSFLYYSEQNEFDNLNVEPRKCCSSMPGEDDSCDTCARR